MKFTVAFFYLLSVLPSPVRGIADQVGTYVTSAYDQSALNEIDAPVGEFWQQFVVTHDDTTRIVLHFESMNIAGSCVLSTRDARSIVQELSSNKYNDYGAFWALSVEHPAVTLTLKCSSAEDVENTSFAIDKYAVSNNSPSIASVCEDDDKVNAICYKDDAVHTDIYEESKKACRIIINGAGACTGWLVGVSSAGNSLLITNHHCIASQSDVENSEFQFMAENDECPGNTSGNNSGDVYEGKTLVKAKAGLDYALIELEAKNGNHAHESYGYFLLENRLPVVGEKIYIPQHAGGRMKQLGISDTFDGSGSCQVKDINRNGCTSGENVDFTYTCDTEGGSSGSPVVLYESNKIIGLHHCGGSCNGNMGVMINNIVDEIADDVIVGPTAAPVPTAAPEPTDTPSASPTGTCNGNFFRLIVKPDNYPVETGFTLKDGNDNDLMTLALTGVILAPNTEHVFDPVCLPAQEYEFTITDTYGDGVCCTYGEGFYKYSVDGTTVDKEGGEFGSSETTSFTVESSTSTPPPIPPSNPAISPPSQAPVCDYLLEMTVQVINGGQTSYELIDDTNTVVFSDSNVPTGTTATEAECLIEGIKYTYKITDTNVNAGNYVLMLNDKVLASGGEFEDYEKVTFRV